MTEFFFLGRIEKGSVQNKVFCTGIEIEKEGISTGRRGEVGERKKTGERCSGKKGRTMASHHWAVEVFSTVRPPFFSLSLFSSP